MERLYQPNPDWHKSSNYRPKGWTETVQGYINEARDLTTCILANQKLMGRPYPWFVTVNIEPELTASEHRALWTKVAQRLRYGGVIALWVREPSESNRVHYHMLVKNDVPKTRITEILSAAITVPFHHQIEPVKTRIDYAYYVTKGKVAGYVKLPDGTKEWRQDKYAHKRLLFSARTKLKKHGKIGKFWEKPREAILKPIIATNKRIGVGLRQPAIHDLVEYAVVYLGIRRSDAKRDFGYWADAPGVRLWIKQLQESGEIPSPHAFPSQPAGEAIANNTKET